MTTGVANLNLLWASFIIEEMSRCGVDTIYAAPGSRCAPLTVAAARHAKLRVVTHFDERGLAFAACGAAAQTRRPVGLITTSGTAVANLLPAVVEASLRELPLLLLTADRPPELQDRGANQTIDQVNIFGRYAESFVELPCPTAALPATWVLSAVDDAMRHVRGGPVHLNCMFAEPLMPSEEETIDPQYLADLGCWRDSGCPFSPIEDSAARLEEEPSEEVVSAVSAQRGVIIAGEEVGDAGSVLSLAAQLGWPILPDITSGLRDASPPALSCGELLLAHPAYGDASTWEVVLHFGGRVTSKRLLECLAMRVPERYIHVQRSARRLDPANAVTDIVDLDPTLFCRRLLAADLPPADPAWLVHWQDGQARCAGALEVFFAEHDELSEPAVARLVPNLIPKDHVLFLGNSMPIRDCNAFATVGPAATVRANRGASGIDGNVATSAGIALGGGVPVTAILGDMALLHDLNSLHLLRDLPVTLIVINNDGGGIFSFLPIAGQEDIFEAFFGTPHGLSFRQAAEQFQLPYICPTTVEEFSRTYAEHVGAPALIEVRTNRIDNRALHAELDRHVMEALKGS